MISMIVANVFVQSLNIKADCDNKRKIKFVIHKHCSVKRLWYMLKYCIALDKKFTQSGSVIFC